MYVYLNSLSFVVVMLKPSCHGPFAMGCLGQGLGPRYGFFSIIAAFKRCRMGSDAAWEAMPHGKRCRMGSEGRSTVSGAEVGATISEAEVGFYRTAIGGAHPQ